MSLQIQILTFLTMFTSGWSLGILFDIYRVVTRPMHLPRWIVGALDIVYWCAATTFVFRMLYMSNYGELRFYVFLGLLIGIGFYFGVMSKVTIEAIQFVIRCIQWVIRFLIQCFTVLVIKPIMILYQFTVTLVGFLVAVSIFLLKIVLQLFYPIWAIARWLMKRLSDIVPWPQWMRISIRSIHTWILQFFKAKS